MFRPQRFQLLLCWLALLVTGCTASGATPQLIGAYPKTTTTPFGGQVAPPPLNIVYHSSLTLEVYDPASAADRVVQIAYDYGGYLTDSEMWAVGNDQYFTLTLAVPAPQFAGVREAILKLGTLTEETVSSDWTSDSGRWDEYATLTVGLRPAKPAILRPAPFNLGWNPVNTFSRAFGVFATIFTFLVDAVIWVAVVLGPFVLMGLGLRAVVQRLRRRA